MGKKGSKASSAGADKARQSEQVRLPAEEDLLAAATVVWYDEMLKSYCDDPHSFEARLLAAEALVSAVQTIAERDPEDGRLIQKYLIAKLKN